MSFTWPWEACGYTVHLCLFRLYFFWADKLRTSTLKEKKKTEKNRNVSPSLVGWLQLFCAFRYKDAQLINQLLSPIYCCVRYWSDVETLECSNQFWGSYLWIYVHEYFFSSCKSSKVIYCNGNDMCTKWLLQLQVISDLSHLFPCVVCCAHKATLY